MINLLSWATFIGNIRLRRIHTSFLKKMGDFNLHVDSVSSIPAKKFLTMMESYGFHQYVTGPTHDKGHTLDLVFARPDDGLISYASVTSRISDHHAVECRLTICPPLFPTKRVLYRQLKSIDCDAVKEDILALPLLTTPEHLRMDWSHSTMTGLLFCWTNTRQ